MKNIKIKVFADPGHAWARFPKSRLAKLGIADKISTYSYQNGDNAFLEEDCDLSVLITALKSEGYDIVFDESHTNKQSKIRSYETYKFSSVDNKSRIRYNNGMVTKQERKMKVSELTSFVDRKNAFSFGGKLLSLQSASDRQTIAEMIDSELSPENLSCDGELSHSEVSRRYQVLSCAGKQLQALDPSVKIWELA
jgi:hypothetical protein